MPPISAIQPAKAASVTRNPSLAPRLVISTRYTDPISTATPMMTVRMPRSSNSQLIASMLI
jgi:hypothetical protein